MTTFTVEKSLLPVATTEYIKEGLKKIEEATDKTTSQQAERAEYFITASLPAGYFVYRGGSHIAVHQQEGNPERIMFITFREKKQ